MGSKKQIEDLFEKLSEGRATEEELKQAMKILRNREDLDSDILPDLEMLDEGEADVIIDSSALWTKIEDQLKEQENVTRWWQTTLVRVAAAIILMIAAGWVSVKVYHEFSWKEYTTHGGEIRSIDLADGSTVVLNGNSKLSVKRNLSRKKLREVFLTGEANFWITKGENEEARFVVHTRDLDVEVLGTRFNVNSRDLETIVYLEEGSVKVERKDRKKEEVYLTPGEKIEYSSVKQELKLSEVKSEVNEISWREGIFEFEDLTLHGILKQITGAYNYRFDIKSIDLQDRTYTVRIPDNNLEFAISVLEKLTGATITDEGGLLIVKDEEQKAYELDN